ncbi:GNAT family N-acetyltransferase [Catellatospora citrea]|uniref:Acetyltransferase n=1 Tax=Catellatospora citrea TaxID=53366 RepID=A0A8J3P605_9ACTN|nr:GNAT family N-acetyltransferase [Catellatospora citrea]RKE10635.1 acetyltransferase (GNAT) family protein [Catellatospora citrea]GIG02921.1 acetyltransferase [Catellatospora citrea]
MAQTLHDLGLQLAANRQYWAGWAGADPDADLAVYRSDIRHGMLNGVLRVRDRPLDEAITEARQRLAGSRWVWWVGADSDEGTAEGLLAAGARQVSGPPVMAVDVTTVANVEAPADLKIVTVAERAQMSEYVAAYAEPLGFDLDGLEPVIERELDFGYPDVIRLAGIVDGRTVATCALLLGAEVGGLFCVATDRAYRGRGIATALTLDALRIVRESGRRVATLQASSDGEPVYRRIGFETVSHYRMFRLPE